jgi:hypothetical protein
VVDAAIQFLSADATINTPGLFRVAPEQAEMESLQARVMHRLSTIEEGEDVGDLLSDYSRGPAGKQEGSGGGGSGANVAAVATLLKRFFAGLDEPLVPLGKACYNEVTQFERIRRIYYVVSPNP